MRLIILIGIRFYWLLQVDLLEFGAVVEIGDHGHRTPNDVFRKYIQGIIGELGQIVEIIN